MGDQIDEGQVSVQLSTSDIQLILTGLRFLLEAEDDASEIERLKRLIDRLEGLRAPQLEDDT